MKTRLTLACLLSLACVVSGAEPLPNEAIESAASAAEFHDPFATESTSSEPQIKVSDPLEPMNRVFYHFNDKLYTWILKPVAKGYRTVTPTPVREGIGRVFDNVKFPVRLVNNVLEARLSRAGIETARFVVNTTVGIGGFFDPATHWNLKAQPADFDKTLAIYHLPTGIYLNWPVFGPSSVRGTVGLAGDTVLNPCWYIDNPWISGGVSALERVNSTSLHLQDYETFKTGTLDPYVALRSAYFENRASAIKK